MAPPDPLPAVLDDEDEPISINYTSGTTGRPKGAVYHHRGAYLNALAAHRRAVQPAHRGREPADPRLRLHRALRAYMICERQEGWDELPLKEQAQLLGRQGVNYVNRRAGPRRRLRRPQRWRRTARRWARS